MSEQTGKGHPERRTHPEIHEREDINDPKFIPRILAQRVLDTMDLTFNYGALQIDEATINELIKDPQKNWGQIAALLSAASVTAAELTPQITSMDQALKNLAEDQEPLPISYAGDPPRKIVDRRVVDELTKAREQEINRKRMKEQRKQVNWTPEKKAAYNEKQRAGLFEEIQENDLRRLANLISIVQQDTIRQHLSPVRGWGEIIGNSEYDPGLEPMIGKVVLGMNQGHKYIQLGRVALEQYSQGNLPDEPTARSVVTGGTQKVAAYLDTFAQTPPPSNPK